MKAACLFLILGLVQAEEGPQEAAYWSQKRENQKRANVIQRPNTGTNLRQKVTSGSSVSSASDYWAQKKATKSTATSNSNAGADYWAKKAQKTTVAKATTGADYWAQKAAKKTDADT